MTDNKEYLRGYIEGFKEALSTAGQDLKDHELKEYGVEEYGDLYLNVAKQIGDCMKCENVGSDKGCGAGKTIWCPRIMETLKEE